MLLRALLLALALPLVAQAQFVPAPLPGPLQKYPGSNRFEFGTITVPEDHANPGNGRIVRLAVVKIPAINPVDADPVFYIVGGPGGSATAASGWFPVFNVLNQTRDVVFVDPRGAGYSLPNLYMRRNGNTIGSFTSANRAWFAENDIDPSFFNTTQIAKDYEAARVALGYPTINLFASSYGTFVAQELLRRYPSKLRAVVMSGNAPATDPFLPSVLRDEKAGMEALIRDVTRNALARRAFPRFRQRFYKMMDRLTNDPVTVTIPNRDTSRPERVVIDGREFVSTMVRMLQSTKNMRYIPALVAEMERKTNGPLLRRFFAPPFEAKIDNPFGMYLSVLGTDIAAPGYVKETERGILRVGNRSLIRAEGPILYQLANLVVSWGVPYNPGTTRTLPQSTVRTLFLNGMMDAQTPVSGGATIAAGGVTNSVNYTYPRIGHAVGFLTGPDMDAAVAFIRNPAQAPTYSRRGLTGKKFYVTNARTARVRTLDNWRDSVIDSPVTVPFLPGRD